MVDKHPPFSKKSDGYKRMVELFDEGKITSDMPPKVAYQTDTLFLKYKPESFRAGLNKYKTEKGYHLRVVGGSGGDDVADDSNEVEDDLKLKEKALLQCKDMNAVQKCMEVQSSDMNIGDSKSSVGSRKSYSDGMGEAVGGGIISNWHPIHFKATFKDGALRDRLGIVVLLPSGITEKENVTAKVQKDGAAIHVRVGVPNAVTDPNIFLLFSALPRYANMMRPAQEFRLRAFHEAMAKQRSMLVATVWRDFVLLLDFPVTEDIPIVEIMTIDNCFYLYVELLAKEKISYMDNNGRLTGSVVDLNTIACKSIE